MDFQKWIASFREENLQLNEEDWNDANVALPKEMREMVEKKVQRRKKREALKLEKITKRAADEWMNKIPDPN